MVEVEDTTKWTRWFCVGRRCHGVKGSSYECATDLWLFLCGPPVYCGHGVMASALCPVLFTSFGNPFWRASSCHHERQRLFNWNRDYHLPVSIRCFPFSHSLSLPLRVETRVRATTWTKCDVWRNMGHRVDFHLVSPKSLELESR